MWYSYGFVVYEWSEAFTNLLFSFGTCSGLALRFKTVYSLTRVLPLSLP